MRLMAFAMACLMALPAQAQVAKQLFGAERTGSAQRPEPFGSYSKGCAAGLSQLPETGSSWQAMRLSRNRNWGHPELIAMVEDLGRYMDRIGWGGIYVGDMSQPRGGPMTSGHASHQIGLDVDVWLYPAVDMTLSARQREDLSAVSMARGEGAYTNGNWTRGQHELVKHAAQDPRVARIFIFPGAKAAMCATEPGDRSWLRKVRPWYNHREHMHVRLSCPRGARACVDQDPPPPGDGCAEAEQWVRDILNPPPPRPRDPNAEPAPPKRDLRLADLPGQCASVLSSR